MKIYSERTYEQCAWCKYGKFQVVLVMLVGIMGRTGHWSILPVIYGYYADPLLYPTIQSQITLFAFIIPLFPFPSHFPLFKKFITHYHHSNPTISISIPLFLYQSRSYCINLQSHYYYPTILFQSHYFGHLTPHSSRIDPICKHKAFFPPNSIETNVYSSWLGQSKNFVPSCNPLM